MVKFCTKNGGKKMKKFKVGFLCLVVLALFMVSVTSFAADEFPAPRIVKNRPLKIGYLYMGPVADSLKRHYHQAEIEVAHRGWKLTPAASTEAVEQREAFMNFLSQDVDAIVCTYVHMEALADLVVQARKQGIGVYCSDTELRPGVLVDVTSGQGVGAAKMAYWGMNQLDYKGKVAVITYSVEQAERERRDVILGLLKNYPGMEVVENQDLTDGADPRIAYDYVTNWVTKYGDDLDWICAICDNFAMGAHRAVLTNGFTRDQIFVTGIDGGNTAYAVMMEDYENGPFYATSSQPFEWYTHHVFEAIEEVQVKGILPGEKGSFIPLSRMVLGEQYITTTDDILPNGTSIHAMFNYYGGDPKDPNAWYNWPEAGGAYTLDY